MPMKDLIDVRLYLNDHPAREYNDPANEDSDHTLTRYVEVAAGQFWKLDIRVLQNFNLRFAPVLCAAVETDDLDCCMYGPLDCEKLRHSRGYLDKDYMVISYSSVVAWDDHHGSWATFANQIGVLGVTENGRVPAGMTPEQFDKIGSIRVEFYRAKEVRRSRPYISDGKLPWVLDEISETVAKGSDVKANTKLAYGAPTKSPTPGYYDYIPIDGKHGKVYEFTSKYRSRKALQNLGIIERSPSPAPDLGLQLERANADNEDIRRENKRLRAQLRSISLASSVTIKEESRVSDNIRSLPGGTSVKRQRGDDGDDVVEVAPPRKKPRVIIDLTDD